MMVDKTPLENVAGPCTSPAPAPFSAKEVHSKCTLDGLYDFPVVEKKITRSEDGSLGVKLRTLKKKHHAQITVHSCEPLGPAEKAGLRRGHIIVEVNGACVIGFDHESVVALLRPKRSVGGTNEFDAVRIKVCNPDDFDAVESEKMQKQAVPVVTKNPVTPSPKKSLSTKSLQSRRLQYTPSQSKLGPADDRLRAAQGQIKNLLEIFDILRKHEGLTKQGESILVDAGIIQLLNKNGAYANSDTGGAVVNNRVLKAEEHSCNSASVELSGTMASFPTRQNQPRNGTYLPESVLQSHGAKAIRSPSRSASLNHSTKSARLGRNSNASSSHDRDNTAIAASNERRRINGPQYMQKFDTKKSKKSANSSAKTAWPIDGRRAKMPKDAKKNCQQRTTSLGLQVVQLHDVVPMNANGEYKTCARTPENEHSCSSAEPYKDFVRNTNEVPDEWKKQSSPRSTRTNVMDGVVISDPIYKMKSIGASGSAETHRTLL
eukprot:m.532383 g.532383  ORF g.532383 m.532383 type:complete len:489 (+) comp22044_c0_seq1:183-1649(+)